MKRTLKITDLDYSFRSHPITGNLVIKSGEDAIKQSVKTLVLLNYFEKPFSVISGNVKGLLFENFNIVEENKLRNRIFSILDQYEPRISVVSIDTQLLENTLNITITYTIIGEESPEQAVSVVVTRTR
jgi:phage baseplate assembly protein W